MVLTSGERIKVGSRVKGSHGPLITNPNASVKRQVREVVIGTVLRACGIAKWDVCFNFDGKVKQNISSRSLQLIPDDSGIPLNEETRLVAANENMVSESTAARSVSVVFIYFYFTQMKLTRFDCMIQLG